MRPLLFFVLCLFLLPVVSALPHDSYPSFAHPQSRVSLGASDTSITISDTIIYNTAYYNLPGSDEWVSFSLGDNFYPGSDSWLDGVGFSDSLPEFPDNNESYILYYSCTFISAQDSESGSSWDCHNATGSPNGFWQLVVINNSVDTFIFDFDDLVDDCGLDDGFCPLSLTCLSQYDVDCSSCKVDSQCDDGVVCTVDTCSNGVCSNLPIDGCGTSFCVGAAQESCVIENGIGVRVRSCNMDSSSWKNFGACLVSSCSEGYVQESFSCVLPSPGDTFYVDPVAGVDSNSGSVSSPWKSIAHAASMATGGDTVYLMNGSYGDVKLGTKSAAGFDNPASQLYGDWVIFTAYHGHEPHFNSITIGSWKTEYGFDLPFYRGAQTKANIIFDGVYVDDGFSAYGVENLVIRNSFFRTINSYPDIITDTAVKFFTLHNVLFENNLITHTGHGIQIMGNNLQLVNNTITGVYQDAISFIGGRDVLIEGNLLRDIDDGVDDIGDNKGFEEAEYSMHSDAIHPYIVGWGRGGKFGEDIINLTVRGNIIYDAELSGFLIGWNPISVYENTYTGPFIFENNVFGPFRFRVIHLGATPREGFIFRHNTVLHAPNHYWASHAGRFIPSDALDYQFSLWGGSQWHHNFQMYNNLLPYTLTTSSALDSYGFVADNLFLNGSTDVELKGYGSVISSPAHVDVSGTIGEWIAAGNLDAMLPYGSVAIDAGSTSYPIVNDINGNLRDAFPDIGAFESSVSSLQDDPQPTVVWGSDIPHTLKSFDEYADIVYIDPSSLTPGDGSSPDSPLSSWSEVVFSSNTAYVQKRGTIDNLSVTVAVVANDSFLGAYGFGHRPVLSDESALQYFVTVQGNNTIVRDLEFVGNSGSETSQRGIVLDGDNITLYNTSIHGVSRVNAFSFCLSANGFGLKILHNDIFNCRMEAFYVGGPYMEFAHNTIYDVALQALDDPLAEFNGADIIQLIYTSCEGISIHDNFMNGSLINRKFALINTDCEGGDSSLLFERNRVIMSNNRPVFHLEGTAIMRNNYFEHEPVQSVLPSFSGMIHSYLTELNFSYNVVKNYDILISSSGNRNFYNNLIISEEPHSHVFSDAVGTSHYVNNLVFGSVQRLWWHYGSELASNNLFTDQAYLDESRAGDYPVFGDPLLAAEFSLLQGSAAIDAGMVIDGFHCPTAGEHPESDCVQWFGSAPDIGAFESSYS